MLHRIVDKSGVKSFTRIYEAGIADPRFAIHSYRVQSGKVLGSIEKFSYCSSIGITVTMCVEKAFAETDTLPYLTPRNLR